MDLLGRNIKTLVNETMEGGYYDIEWDGTMDNGVSVPLVFI